MRDLKIAGVLGFLRENFPNDGAEGESVHALANAYEQAERELAALRDQVERHGCAVSTCCDQNEEEAKRLEAENERLRRDTADIDRMVGENARLRAENERLRARELAVSYALAPFADCWDPVAGRSRRVVTDDALYCAARRALEKKP